MFIPTTELTQGGTPSGPAGGDLGGTYPNPTVPGLAALEYSGARLTKSEDQVLGGAADITWDVEDWDTDAYHSGANSERLIAPSNGLYRISFSFRMNGDIAGFAAITRSDGAIIFQDYGTLNTRGGTVDVALTAAQYVVLNFNAAATIDSGGGGNPIAFFAIQRLAIT